VRAADQVLVERRKAAQLGRGRPKVGGDARVRQVLRREHLGAADVRRRPDGVRLGLERAYQRLGPFLGRSGERVERAQRRTPEVRLPRRAGGARGPELAAAHADLERVRERRVGEPARRAQPREQVVGGAARQRGARTGQHARAEPRASERHAAVVAHRDPVAGEHLCEQRGRAGIAAEQHRDVGRLDPLPHQLERRGADELGLGALAAGLEQAHRPVGRALDRVGLEQRPLQVVQRRSSRRRVVLGPLRQRHDVCERPQLLDGRGTAGERDAPRLVRQRDEHVDAGVANEGLHRVALDRREVVEAVEEHGPPAPGAGGGAERVERGPRVALVVGPADPLQPAPVSGVERAELGGVRAPAGAGRGRGVRAGRARGVLAG
jgi:hypothetical protein